MCRGRNRMNAKPAALLGEQISGLLTSAAADGQTTGGPPAGPDKDTLTRRSHQPVCILHLESTETVLMCWKMNTKTISRPLFLVRLLLSSMFKRITELVPTLLLFAIRQLSVIISVYINALLAYTSIYTQERLF